MEQISIFQNELAQSIIVKHFSKVPDFRQPRKVKHKLFDILVMVFLATLCGADNWEDIVNYCLSNREWLKSILGLSNGIPSQDTFERVFSLLKPQVMHGIFFEIASELKTKLGINFTDIEDTTPDTIAIDGKTARRSHTGKTNSALHLVSAYSHRYGITLTQTKVDEKSNEITAVPEVLSQLAIENCVITVDALNSQTKIAEQIIKQGGDYVFPIKGNHPTLEAAIKAEFNHARMTQNRQLKVGDYDQYEQTEGGHGRIESRKVETLRVTVEFQQLNRGEEWAGLEQLVKATRKRKNKGEDNWKEEEQYFITSRKASAKEIGKHIRRHWGVENQLHWQLDISFLEDSNRSRAGNIAENLSIIRRLCLNMIKNTPFSRKSGIKSRRKRAGWDKQYLMDILSTKQGQ
jgi:predicted transposase YbfD/YdcC